MLSWYIGRFLWDCPTKQYQFPSIMQHKFWALMLTTWQCMRLCRLRTTMGQCMRPPIARFYPFLWCFSINFFLLKIFSLIMCVCIVGSVHICIRDSGTQTCQKSRNCSYSWLWVTWNRFWKANSSPVQEQQELLSAELLFGGFHCDLAYFT